MNKIESQSNTSTCETVDVDSLGKITLARARAIMMDNRSSNIFPRKEIEKIANNDGLVATHVRPFFLMDGRLAYTVCTTNKIVRCEEESQ